MKQKIEIEVEIPDGYRFVRFGRANRGETYVLSSGEAARCEGHATIAEYAIFEPLPKRYREPDARDAGKEIEVSYANGLAWHKRTYIGRSKASEFITEDEFGSLGRWIQARVIDDSEPAIDVGEGYRMADERDIGKEVEPTDRPSNGSWALNKQLTRILRSIDRSSEFPFMCDVAWKYARVKA